jgi:hypothetical protein
MALDINFNNPTMLQAYKEQALSQVGLEDFGHRIVVGEEGGLAYTLFKRKMDFPLQFRICSASEKESVLNYFDAIGTYLKNAGNHSERHQFGLVRVDPNNIITPGMGLDDFIYEAALGSLKIESAERFEAFLEMVKSGKGELDKQYERLVEKAKPLFLR